MLSIISHIADTIQFVISNFNEFVKTNEAVAMQKKSKEVVTLKEMGDAMKAMPHYQEMLTKYSLHIHMANQCMKVYKHKRLEELGNAEQDIATGLNSEGSKVKNFVARATPLLSDAGLNADDRKRLLMILAACDGTQTAFSNCESFSYFCLELKESDRRVLMEKIPVTPGSPAHIAFDALMSLRGQSRAIPQSKDDKKREKAKQKEKKKAAKAEEVSYQLARYENRVQKILDDFVHGQLSLEAFPYVGNVDAAAIANEAQPVSLKSQTEGGWASKAKKSDVPTKEATTILGSRVIVFMIGGMTYSEIRAAYEVGEEAQREILIGREPCLLELVIFANLYCRWPLHLDSKGICGQLGHVPSLIALYFEILRARKASDGDGTIRGGYLLFLGSSDRGEYLFVELESSPCDG
jgi:syntaxin-binding protein 1